MKEIVSWFLLYFLLSLNSCEKQGDSCNDTMIVDVILQNHYYNVKLCDYSSFDTQQGVSIKIDSLNSNEIEAISQKMLDSFYTSALTKIPCMHTYIYGKNTIAYFKEEFFFELFTGENGLIDETFSAKKNSIEQRRIEKGTKDFAEKTGFQNRAFYFLEGKIIRSSIKLNLAELNFYRMYPNTSLNQINHSISDRRFEQFRISDILYDQEKSKAVVYVKIYSHQEMDIIYFLEKFGWKWEIVLLEYSSFSN